jgi:hypothetical protein
MHECFARRLGRRIVALAAAYAIALSSLIASFSLIQMPHNVGADQGTVVCHGKEQQNPASSDNGKLCLDTCCIGCLTSTAVLPEPSAEAAQVRHASIPLLGPVAAIVRFARPETKSHQSRAPPYAA